MQREWFRRLHKSVLGICALVLIQTSVGQAGENEATLRSVLEEQQKQIEELRKRLENLATAPAANVEAGDPAKPQMDDAAVKKIVADYLKDNPGAGMPPSVQTGYTAGGGFFVRSAPEPKYVKWDDQCRIPFELRIRGRMQIDYYNYKVTNRVNHLTNRLAGQNANAPGRQADFSQLEIKRGRLLFEGTAFDPDLRYHVTLDGNTRGIGGFQNNKVFTTAAGTTAPNAAAASGIGGGVNVDHAVRLFSAYLAYDFHGCGAAKGCGLDCPEGTALYAPTYTIIAGKIKPPYPFEESLGSFNQQFVEFAMTEWFFDAEDDNLMMAAGTQIKALEDRLFFSALITNGSESQFPNTQMDHLPGFNFALYYDFGGTWNEEKKKWDLYGDGLADLNYSCNPVVRVGAASNIVFYGRRSLYGDLEQSRIFVVPGGPQGGTRLINVLNGDALTPGGAHAVDDFDQYNYETFVAAKWRGFSITNDWFFRSLNAFRSTPNGQGNIIYQDSTGSNALFPRGQGLFDYGMLLQGGYFIVPKKLEVAARWSWIRGDSGDINGSGRFTTVNIPGVVDAMGNSAPVHVVAGAFRNFHEANEYAIGVNYYFKGQQLKWSTDFSVYRGGNPAGGGQSPTGFIAGSDGWLLRTQVQLAF
jgi:hypothetical protein